MMQIIIFLLLPFILLYVRIIKIFKKQCPYCKGLETRFYRDSSNKKDYVCYECGQLF